MELNTVLAIGGLILFTIISLLGASFVFYRYIYRWYKIRSYNVSYDELIGSLNAIINTELDIYTKNVFSKKGGLNNANFENYYQDISKHIYNGISKDLLTRLSFYLTEDEIITLIAKTTLTYLQDKA